MRGNVCLFDALIEQSATPAPRESSMSANSFQDLFKTREPPVQEALCMGVGEEYPRNTRKLEFCAV